MPPPFTRRLRSLLAALALVAALGCVAALAQKVQVAGGVPALFMPTAGELVAAIGCLPPACLTPLPPATSLTILRQQRDNEPLLRAWRTPWSPADELQLFVRYRVDGNKSAPFTTGWFEIGPGVTDMFRTADPNTGVEVEYQLRLGDGASAGSYQTEVLYDAGDGSRGASHVVTVAVAPVVMLRLDGVPAGAEATIAFDYALSPLAYLGAVTNGELLPLTGADLAAVEVFSNSPGGYRVTVSVTQFANIDGNLFPEEKLFLDGVPAPSRVFVGTAPTDGYETLLLAEDYRLAVDGDEEPGGYRLLLTFSATTLP